VSLLSLTEAFAAIGAAGTPAGEPPRGLLAVNVIQLEHAEAYVTAAERTGTPLVLQLSENAVRYHGDLAPITAACRALADVSPARLVLHLDHATDQTLVEEALHLGFGSVMFDASALPDAENRRLTAEVASRCHAAGVSIEAELGEVGGKDGVHAPGARTDPDEAARFVTDTGVDALAVAVGSSHAMTERTAHLDTELITALHKAVPVPLVLHGSSGVDDAGIVAAVHAGITKVNIATRLNVVATQAVRDALTDERMVDPRKYLGAFRAAVTAETERLQQLLV